MKMIKSLFLFVFVFAIGFSQTASAQSRAVVSEAQRITGDRFTIAATTPKGARVYAVSRPSQKMLDAIDSGLEDLFAVARKNNLRNRLNFSDFTIFIARADRTQNSSQKYSPDIAVGAAQYQGSVYDQGGYIYAAGMIVGYNPNAFIIAEHTKNFERVSEVVRYEGEHIVLYHNNRRLYNETADHSRGGGHPILQ